MFRQIKRQLSQSVSKFDKKSLLGSKILVKERDLKPLSAQSLYIRTLLEQHDGAAQNGIDRNYLHAFKQLSAEEKFKYEVQSLASHWIVQQKLKYLSRLSIPIVLDRGSPYRLFLAEKSLEILKEGKFDSSGIQGLKEFQRQWTENKEKLLPVYAQKIMEMEQNDFDRKQFKSREHVTTKPVRPANAFVLFVQELNDKFKSNTVNKESFFKEMNQQDPSLKESSEVPEHLGYYQKAYEKLTNQLKEVFNQKSQELFKQYKIAQKEYQMNKKLTDLMIDAHIKSAKKANIFEEFVRNYESQSKELPATTKRNYKTSRPGNPLSKFMQFAYEKDSNGSFTTYSELNQINKENPDARQAMKKRTEFIINKWKGLSDEEKKKFTEAASKSSDEYQRTKENFQHLLSKVQQDFNIEELEDYVEE